MKDAVLRKVDIQLVCVTAPASELLDLVVRISCHSRRSRGAPAEAMAGVARAVKPERCEQSLKLRYE